MTNQEAFDRVAKHLLQQTTRSFRKTCKYAGPDGNACAIGCLLPRPLAEQLDDLDNTDWVSVVNTAKLFNNSVFEESKAAREALDLLDGVNNRLLVDLQRLHDNTFLRDEEGKHVLRQGLREIAEKYNLMFSEC